MTTPEITAPLPLLLGTFGYCIVSGFIPVVHADAYLVVVSALTPPPLRLPLALAAAFGQMIAKAAMYGVGRGVLRVPGARTHKWVVKAEAWCATRRTAEKSLVFVSAASGLPPFFLVSIACGMMQVSFVVFLVLGFAGRFVRFGAVVLVPHLISGH